jgi:hypothetical protein
VALLASQPVAASAATSMVGTIHGGGSANMTDLRLLPGQTRVSTFGIKVKLFSDGSARGDLNCVDVVGDPPGYPGKIFGDITSWSQNEDGAVSLIVTNGMLIPGGPPFSGGHVIPVGSFTVTIQHFGGAGVGHWTLDLPGHPSPFNGGPICQERLTNGHIVGNGDFRLRD